VRYNTHQVADHAELLKKSATDGHGRVRMEAITAASWLPKNTGLAILDAAQGAGTDSWIEGSMDFALAALKNSIIEEPVKKINVPKHLTGPDALAYKLGHEVYHREAHCATCHQTDGKGLPAAQFPPVAGTKWSTQNEDRLIKLTLNGLYGPIEVLGKKYPGQVPMTQFGGILNDKEVAAVLTYVRNSFGNKASVITPKKVADIRAATRGKQGFYSPDELLKQHPHE
jgi:mono/diheme cytochrome c family protein